MPNKAKNRKFNFDLTSLEKKEYKEWDVVEIQILRMGEWKHPIYGTVKIDQKFFDTIASNFNDNVLGQEIPVDIDHSDDKEAAARYKELRQDGKNMFASIELNKLWAEKFSDKRFKYFSPEYMTKWTNWETGKTYKNVLIGWGLTNLPYFKGMNKVVANDDMSNGMSKKTKEIFYFNYLWTMDKFKELLQKFSEKAILSLDEKFELNNAFSELKEEEKTEVKADVDTEMAKPQEEAKKEEKKKEKKVEKKKEEEKKVEMSDKKFAEVIESNVKMSEQIAKLQTEQRTREFSDMVKDTEKNDVSILEKDREAVLEFCEEIGKDSAKKFFEILNNLKVAKAFTANLVKSDDQKFEDDNGEKMVSDIKAIVKESNGKMSYADASREYHQRKMTD